LSKSYQKVIKKCFLSLRQTAWLSAEGKKQWLGRQLIKIENYPDMKSGGEPHQPVNSSLMVEYKQQQQQQQMTNIGRHLSTAYSKVVLAAFLADSLSVRVCFVVCIQTYQRA
jgi:hypothetical protein